MFNIIMTIRYSNCIFTHIIKTSETEIANEFLVVLNDIFRTQRTSIFIVLLELIKYKMETVVVYESVNDSLRFAHTHRR